jgi:hypothetical protein
MGRLLIGIILGLGLALAIGILRAPSQTDPVYYVDGARPLPTHGAVLDTALGDFCVPYSSEHRGLLICGEIPDDFVPASNPGPESRFPGICELALSRVEALGYPPVSPSSCWVTPTSSSPSTDDPAGAEWLVTFNPSSPDAETVTIPLDTTPR